MKTPKYLLSLIARLLNVNKWERGPCADVWMIEWAEANRFDLTHGQHMAMRIKSVFVQIRGITGLS